MDENYRSVLPFLLFWNSRNFGWDENGVLTRLLVLFLPHQSIGDKKSVRIRTFYFPIKQ